MKDTNQTKAKTKQQNNCNKNKKKAEKNKNSQLLEYPDVRTLLYLKPPCVHNFPPRERQIM